MKLITPLVLLFVGILLVNNVKSQTNVSINIVGANLGLVPQNGVLDLNVQVTNTGSNPTGANKISTFISVPSAIALIISNAQQTGLPAGWSINNNDGETIEICNGTDNIGAGVSRNFIVKVQGTAVGGPSTIAGALDFTDGTCGNFGFTLAGDNIADNNSTTTITVTTTTPLTLTNFNVTNNNCIPTLRWSTENEVNTSNFSIEKNSNTNSDWVAIGTVNSVGNSSIRTNYTFIDNNNITTNKALYRLKMIDRNGEFKYSPIVLAQLNCKETSAIVYPNPVKNGVLNISVNGFTNNIIATLKSASGQIVLSEKVVNGSNNLIITNIANGLYYVEIMDKNGNSNLSKVIIQK
jgi:Secretion system C-terminal sorting domain